MVHRVLSDLRALHDEALSGFEELNHVATRDSSEDLCEHSVSCGKINYCYDHPVVQLYFWVHLMFAYKTYIICFYNRNCIVSMPGQMQNRYTSIRVDLEVYNALLSTKKILEQAYNRKFSLSETIQVVNRLSYETVQQISSARRELDEMLDGRGSSSKSGSSAMKDVEYVLKSGADRFSRTGSKSQ